MTQDLEGIGSVRAYFVDVADLPAALPPLPIHPCSAGSGEPWPLPASACPTCWACVADVVPVPQSEIATSARRARSGARACGRRPQPPIQAREQVARLDPRPVRGQVLEGKPGVEIGQPSPGGEHRDVRRERRPRATARRSCGRPVASRRRTRRTAGEGVDVPPLAHPRGHVAGAEVVAAEELGVGRQAGPVQGVDGLVVQRGGRHPDAGRGGAEAEAGQQGPQGVPAIALGLGHREDQHQPAVGRGGPGPGPDAVVALPQQPRVEGASA